MLTYNGTAEDIAFAESRIRAETVAAEDVLLVRPCLSPRLGLFLTDPPLAFPQDKGAISMISSDAQAMGRIGEVISRTWRTASKMREFTGPLEGEKEGSDNERVKVSCPSSFAVRRHLTNSLLPCFQRYIAKYTINPYVSVYPPHMH